MSIGLTPRDYAVSNNHLHVAEHLDSVMRALGDANGLTPTGINKFPTVAPNQLRSSDVFYNAQASKQQPRRSSTSGAAPGIGCGCRGGVGKLSIFWGGVYTQNTWGGILDVCMWLDVHTAVAHQHHTQYI